MELLLLRRHDLVDHLVCGLIGRVLDVLRQILVIREVVALFLDIQL
jgi:hypothetical protein